MSINRPTSDPCEITDDQIEALRIEAGAAGDSAQVAICDRALNGDDAARVECSRLIQLAQAQLDAMPWAHKPSPLVHAPAELHFSALRGVMLLSKTRTRTITLTDRQPVTIREEDWPFVATAKWWDQSNRTVSVRVREHEDGRRIVYGVSTSWSHSERGAKAGVLLANQDGDATIAAIHDVAVAIGYPLLAAMCIADLPAEELR